MRRRLVAHAAVLLLAWPIASIASATLEARMVPYVSAPWSHALRGASAAAILLAPDFVLVGAGMLALSVLLFRRFGRQPLERMPRFRRLCLEPMAMLTAIFCGTAIWYPTVLSAAIFAPFWTLPSSIALGTIACIGVSLVHDVVPRGKRLRLGVALAVVGLAVPAASIAAGALPSRERAQSDVVLLGIDSLAQTDDIAPFRRWVASRGGAWYERAVTPGLLTNAVWASVMTMLPVREHGVFHTFQEFPAGRAALLEHARNAGFHTISVFSDQTTCAIGSQAGFDEDRSGPVGWRQLGLSIVQNSSVFLPLFRPLLPRTPWSVAPPNHAGTFTYDLRRELRGILTSGAPARQTFVAAHLTYLHMAAYPRLVDLSWNELRRVAVSPAGSLRDRSLDWEDRDLETDAVPLHRWKIARLQDVLAEVVEETRFVERGGKLLLFSDHGERAGLTPQTFTDERYHHVVLASIGLPASDVQRPTSLREIGGLLGLIHGGRGRDAMVEFASPPRELWSKLAATARVRWSGVVDLDPDLLKLVFTQLQGHRPWAADSRYMRLGQEHRADESGE